MRHIAQVQALIPYLLGGTILARYVPLYLEGPINLTVGRITIICIASLGLGYYVNHYVFPLTTGDIAFLLLFILLTASTAWSIDPFLSVNRVFDLVFYVLLYLGMHSYGHNSGNGYARIWSIFLFSGLFALVVGLYYTLVPSVGEVLNINSNVLARHLIAFLPLFVAQAGWTRNIWTRVMYFSLTAGGILVVFLGGSRSGKVVLLALIGPLIYLYARAADRPLYEISSIGLVSMVGVTTLTLLLRLLGVDITILLPTLEASFDPEIIGHDRFAMYVLIADLLPNNWVTGVGYGSFQSIMETSHRKGFVVHNIFFRVWLGAGVVALFLLGKTLLGSARGFISHELESADSVEGVQGLAFGVSLFGLVLMGMFNPILTSPVFITLLAMGSSMSVRKAGNSNPDSGIGYRMANEFTKGRT